jgi:predicted transcriptional regulator
MTSARMPDDLMRRLDAAAERPHSSKGWIIKDALAELNAGELIDGDEVLAWLDLDSAKSLKIYRRSGSWLRAIT